MSFIIKKKLNKELLEAHEYLTSNKQPEKKYQKVSVPEENYVESLPGQITYIKKYGGKFDYENKKWYFNDINDK